MSLLLEIPPATLGLPPKFTSFRETQAAAIDYFLQSEKKYVAACAPTGVGKSLLGLTVAKLLESKAVYLTATKALQEQITGDFGVSGMKDIRGRANYLCRLYTTKGHKNVSCDEGQEQGCQYAGTTGCPYFCAYEKAKSSHLISTNYSYWLHSRTSAANALEVPDGRAIDLLICDEAHNAMDELGRFLAVHLSTFDLADNFPAYDKGQSGLMNEATGDRWRNWAQVRLKEVLGELRKLKELYGSVAKAKSEAYELYSQWERLKVKLERISTMGEEWVWEASDDSVQFECVWPGRYGHMLWSGVERVLLMSATLWPYTLRLLGLTKDSFDFKRFENGWPPNRGINYYLPTAKLSYRSDDADYRIVANVMDDIIDSRADRKGIIHTVSYARMRRLLQFSRHGKRLFYNETSGDSVSVADRFRRAKPPAVLISPSYGTGWDFAYDQCEYQIIPKIPFPYAESRVMKERMRDDSYRFYSAALELTQMIGRGRRAPDDRCETFILDKTYPLLMARGRQFAKGLNVHKISTIPNKPEKLSRKAI